MSMDNRNAPRAPLDIYVNQYIRGTPVMARSRDISVEGIYLTRVIAPADCESRIGIQWRLPGEREVIYAEGIAVRDLNSTPVHRVTITLLPKSHPSVEGEP